MFKLVLIVLRYILLVLIVDRLIIIISLYLVDNEQIGREQGHTVPIFP